MGAFATFLLTLASEALKMGGELAHAKRVDEIIKERPDLSQAESQAFKKAADRLGNLHL